MNEYLSRLLQFIEIGEFVAELLQFMPIMLQCLDEDDNTAAHLKTAGRLEQKDPSPVPSV